MGQTRRIWRSLGRTRTLRLPRNARSSSSPTLLRSPPTPRIIPSSSSRIRPAARHASPRQRGRLPIPRFRPGKPPRRRLPIPRQGLLHPEARQNDDPENRIPDALHHQQSEAGTLRQILSPDPRTPRPRDHHPHPRPLRWVRPVPSDRHQVQVLRVPRLRLL